jgi:hypothetical protein
VHEKRAFGLKKIILFKDRLDLLKVKNTYPKCIIRVKPVLIS